MRKWVRVFGKKALNARDVRGKDVLEVGSRDVNGSLANYINSLGPKSYIRTDKQDGRSVDKVLDVCAVVAEFGSEILMLYFPRKR